MKKSLKFSEMSLENISLQAGNDSWISEGFRNITHYFV